MNYKEKFKNLPRTPWFTGTTKPVYKGYYERYFELTDKIIFQYWDGRFWFSGRDLYDVGYCVKSAHQDNKLWRGCSEDTTKT